MCVLALDLHLLTPGSADDPAETQTDDEMGRRVAQWPRGHSLSHYTCYWGVQAVVEVGRKKTKCSDPRGELGSSSWHQRPRGGERAAPE
jgi:hypothetical protein